MMNSVFKVALKKFVNEATTEEIKTINKFKKCMLEVLQEELLKVNKIIGGD